LTGYISKGIALCGKGLVLDARAAFDVASMYTDQDSETTHFLLLIKVCYICLAYSSLHRVFQAIALFNADQHDEANLLLTELATGCPNTDALARDIVQVSIIHAWSYASTLIFTTRTLGISTRSTRDRSLGWRMLRRSHRPFHCRSRLLRFIMEIERS
jgi:hypothetical protein